MKPTQALRRRLTRSRVDISHRGPLHCGISWHAANDHNHLRPTCIAITYEKCFSPAFSSTTWRWGCWTMYVCSLEHIAYAASQPSRRVFEHSFPIVHYRHILLFTMRCPCQPRVPVYSTAPHTLKVGYCILSSHSLIARQSYFAQVKIAFVSTGSDKAIYAS